MNRKFSSQLLALFFLSGACGLIYEILWTRMLVLVFGNTTHSIVAVVSAFLAGLAIGNFLAGRRSDRLPIPQLMRIYSWLEIAIGITSLASLFLFTGILAIYPTFTDGQSVSLGLLLLKFLFTIVMLIVPTILMGATLPIVVSLVEQDSFDTGVNVSSFYAVNTLGAIVGVLATGFVFIEIFGLQGTLFLAVAINIGIGVFARMLKPGAVSPKSYPSATIHTKLNSRQRAILVLYAISGLTAIAYQVLWTRLLTPRTGVFIYAFATILAVYLFGIAFGSWIFSRFLVRIQSRQTLFFFCQLGIGVAALCSVFFTSIYFNFLQISALFVIVPATICMGISFPLVVVIISGEGNTGRSIGLVYSWNTVGSILGGFLASFLFIPLLGASKSTILLAMVNLTLAFILIWMEREGVTRVFRLMVSSILIALAGIGTFVLLQQESPVNEKSTQMRINWARSAGIPFRWSEDEVASVLAYSDRKNKTQSLYIDGIATTAKVVETKLMAHLPLALHPDPKSILIIAFGMGSTFRSALLHDIDVDVVELVPSVPKMFPLFHNDADEVLRKPRGRIIINDGRNYVLVTKKEYDVITIDPPPPFNAAGTTVLYAKEFYEQMIKKLTPHGIVSQWLWFGSREDDLTMAMKSFLEVFPYAKVFRSNWQTEGVFMIGSPSPITLDDERLALVFQSPVIKQDIAETNFAITPLDIRNILLTDREHLLPLLRDVPSITDSRPRTEYYLLRHRLTDSPPMSLELLEKRLASSSVHRDEQEVKRGPQ